MRKKILATGSMKALKKICDQNQVPTVKFIQRVKHKWVEKKRASFKFFGSGEIEIAIPGKYTIEGSLDGFGIKRYDTSLKHLLANCVDFEEEESLLQSIGTKMALLLTERRDDIVSWQAKVLNTCGGAQK